MKLTNAMRQAFVSVAMNDVPQINYIEQIHALVLKTAVSLLPPAIYVAYKDSKNRPFINTTYVRILCENVYFPGEVKSHDKIKEQCDSLVLLHEAQTEQRWSLSQSLHAIANSCSTRKALAEALPEFEQYVPADESAGNRLMPVVTGVVQAFAAAGWPKGKGQSGKAARP